MKKVQNRHALKVQLVDNAEKFQNSSAIKVKLEGGGGGTIDVDDELSITSENPVQNKVITQAVNADHEEIGRIGGELANKQDTLTAGTGISISEQNVISATGGGGDSDDIVRLYGTIQTISRNRQLRLLNKDRTRMTWGEFIDAIYTDFSQRKTVKKVELVCDGSSMPTPANAEVCYTMLVGGDDFNSGFTDKISEQMIYAGATLKFASLPIARSQSGMMEYGAPVLQTYAFSGYLNNEVTLDDYVELFVGNYVTGGELLTTSNIVFDEYKRPNSSYGNPGMIWIYQGGTDDPKVCEFWICVGKDLGYIWVKMCEQQWDW